MASKVFVKDGVCYVTDGIHTIAISNTDEADAIRDALGEYIYGEIYLSSESDGVEYGA
jgi:hypothetical protein